MSRFIGHADELSILSGLVSSVSDGVGGVLIVEGEQGIGKTALLRAGLTCIEDVPGQLLWGTADEFGQAIPLRLMSECLPTAGVAVAMGHPDWPGERALSQGVSLVMAATERILGTMDRLCADGPVVLVAEDLQWADDASIQVWRELSRAVGQMPLLLVGSMRSGFGRGDVDKLRHEVLAQGGHIARLDRLAELDVADLLEGLLGARPGPRLLALTQRAGGNPLYVRELADSLVRDGQILVRAAMAELTDDSSLVRVPTSLSAAITGRLRGLPRTRWRC